MQKLSVPLAGFGLSLLVSTAGLAAPPPPVCYTWANSLDYFLPNYPGWETAKHTWTGTDNSLVYLRKHMYGTNKFELIKFSNPFSSETFTWDNSYIYITAENMQDNSPNSRAWKPGYNGWQLGANWMPRVVCTSGNTQYMQFNRFFSCANGVDHYTGCNSCPCQLSSTEPARCSRWQNTVLFANYDYGGTIGTLPTLILSSPFDDQSGSERYYYGFGRGFLRFEVLRTNGLNSSGWESGETPNDPIPSQACIKP